MLDEPLTCICCINLVPHDKAQMHSLQESWIVATPLTILAGEKLAWATLTL